VDAPADGVASFFLEARVIAPTAQAVASANSVGDTLLPQEPNTGTTRWWFEPPFSYRWEYDLETPLLESGLTGLVSDGQTSFQFDDRLNSFQRVSTPDYPEGYVPMPISSVLIGPLPGGGVDAWAASIAQATDNFGYERVREDELLGLPVAVYSFGPAGERLNEDGTSTWSGQGEMWVHEDSGFVLKWVMDGIDGSGSLVAEVTRLEFDIDIAAVVFEFEPPVGATEVVTAGGSISLSGGPGAPEGFLSVPAVPQGFTQGSSGQSTSVTGAPDSFRQYWSEMAADPVREIRLQQHKRYGGLPEGLKQGEVFDVEGTLVYRRTFPGGVESLAWEQDGISVQLDAAGVELDVLTDMISSAVVSTGDSPRPLYPGPPPHTPTPTAAPR
jgi:outer membrane lipoprotein-sorting protein